MRPFQAMRLRRGTGDPYWANVVSLLHFDGADGGTTFTDQRGKTWTPAGNAQIDTAQYKFGGASGLFDGSGDYISTPDHADFDFLLSDFTIEGWIRPSTISGNGNVIAKVNASDGSWVLFRQGTALKFYASSNGTTYDIANGITVGTIAANTTYHFAVTRQGSAFRTFLEGVAGGTATSSASIRNNTAPVRMGFDSSGGSDYFAGWLDEVRITKGVARYTAAFTPPTAAFPNS